MLPALCRLLCGLGQNAFEHWDAWHEYWPEWPKWVVLGVWILARAGRYPFFGCQADPGRKIVEFHVFPQDTGSVFFPQMNNFKGLKGHDSDFDLEMLSLWSYLGNTPLVRHDVHLLSSTESVVNRSPFLGRPYFLPKKSEQKSSLIIIRSSLITLLGGQIWASLGPESLGVASPGPAFQPPRYLQGFKSPYFNETHIKLRQARLPKSTVLLVMGRYV